MVNTFSAALGLVVALSVAAPAFAQPIGYYVHVSRDLGDGVRCVFNILVWPHLSTAARVVLSVLADSFFNNDFDCPELTFHFLSAYRYLVARSHPGD
jgi:hypothetical protein